MAASQVLCPRIDSAGDAGAQQFPETETGFIILAENLGGRYREEYYSAPSRAENL